MNEKIEEARFAPIEALEASDGAAQLAIAIPPQSQALAFDRADGAQAVAIRRDDGLVLKKIKVMAAAAGDSWYYRFPVRKKIEDPKTGATSWGTDFIEGPSIKLANEVARLFGNCKVDTIVADQGSAWVIYARFTDLETGFSLTRPFQQRKSQAAMKGDRERQLDIAFQIGVSKAIRNVICNSLQTFTDFAFDEAKSSLVNKIGQKLDDYRLRVSRRLGELGIDLRAVERVRGRAQKDWLADDVAKLIAEIQAINDGMASIDETYPPIESAAAASASSAKLDALAADEKGASDKKTEKEVKPSGKSAKPALDALGLFQKKAKEADSLTALAEAHEELLKSVWFVNASKGEKTYIESILKTHTERLTPSDVGEAQEVKSETFPGDQPPLPMGDAAPEA